MPKDIRETTPPHIKATMRRVKELPDKIKAVVYHGAKNPKATMQFNEDIRLYGLWEAILYVQGYEEDDFYVEGTAEKAMAVAVEYFTI